MQKFTAVSIAAESGLLVVFTYVWCKVGDGDGADVCRGFDGTELSSGCVGVLLDEILVGGSAFISTIVLLRSRNFRRSGELMVLY